MPKRQDRPSQEEILEREQERAAKMEAQAVHQRTYLIRRLRSKMVREGKLDTETLRRISSLELMDLLDSDKENTRLQALYKLMGMAGLTGSKKVGPEPSGEALKEELGL